MKMSKPPKAAFYLVMALVGIISCGVQGQKKLSYDDEVGIEHSYFKNGDVKRLTITNGTQKLSIYQKHFLKDLESRSDVMYEITEQLARLPQIELVSKLTDDIIVLKGCHAFFGSVQHLIFYNLRTHSIQKWIAYYASYKNVDTTLLFYGDSLKVRIKNFKSVIYQQTIYALDHQMGTVQKIKPSKKPMRFFSSSSAEGNDDKCTLDQSREYFEFQL